ncbi:MAG: flagellar biosynthesis protein FlhB [Candidatus Sumerlaeota bacterium]
MAEGGDDSSQEKTLEPTQRRIDEAKEKGEFARSKEITMVASFVAVLIFLWLGQDYMVGQTLDMGRCFFQFDRFINLSHETLAEFFWLVLLKFFPIILPIFMIVVTAALVGEFGQIGFHVAKDPFEPKWQKLDPSQGFKRLFSLRQFAEGLKSLIKVSIIAYVAYRTIRGELGDFAQMTENSPRQGVDMMGRAALKLGFRTCAVLVFFAAADYWFQRWQYYKKLRMSHQEMKDEMKQQEGDPVLKQRMRSIQMEIARKRMMQDVPDADFVLTNPTHYACALRYDPEKDFAPMLVAKGQNFVAHKIREIAEESSIPIIENPPLAREIFRKTEVGQPIPSNLFRAVAEIMASIWRLSAKRGVAWAGGPAARQRTET